MAESSADRTDDSLAYGSLAVSATLNPPRRYPLRVRARARRWETHPVASRRPFVGGNWKMNTDLASAVELADDVVAGCGQLIERCDVALFPPFPAFLDFPALRVKVT